MGPHADMRNDEADVGFRVDRETLALRDPVRTRDGFLRVPAVVARPGILEYLVNGRTIRELVPRSTIADEASIETLLGKPVTLRHPPGKVITPDNVRDHQVGVVLTDYVIEDDGKLVVDTMIHDAAGIQALDNGVREASPGYLPAMDWTPGVDPEFGAYDGIQTSRTYNHHAIVDRGRGGSDVEFRVDGEDMQLTPEEIEQLKALLAAAPAILAMIKAKTDADEAAKAAEAAKTEEKPAEVKNDEAAYQAYFTERSKLLGLATRYEVKDAEKLSNAAICKRVVLSANPRLRNDAADDYYRHCVDVLDDEPVKPPPKGKTLVHNDGAELKLPEDSNF